MKINVSIVDDHPIVINGLIKMLGNRSEINLLHCYSSGNDLLNGLRTGQPDVLLLDLEMPDIQGEELTKTIAKRYPKVAVLVLTNRNQHYYLNLLLKNGAKGYLLKSTDIDTLVEAIIAVSKGKRYLDKSFNTVNNAEVIKESDTKKKIPVITKRETQILELIAEGLTSSQIAEKLFIALSTVENHRINLFLKFEVKNAVALVRKGLQMGIIK